jgi:hypothetical protein
MLAVSKACQRISKAPIEVEVLWVQALEWISKAPIEVEVPWLRKEQHFHLNRCFTFVGAHKKEV